MSRRVVINTTMLVLALNLVPLGAISTAHAGVVGSQTYALAEARGERIDRITAFLARDEVRAQLNAMGVDPASTEARLAGLTDAELLLLEQRIGELPAGGSALAVVGVVFIILIILEVVGVTDIFSKV